MSTTETSYESLKAWQTALLEELGFSQTQAIALSAAKVAALVKDKNGVTHTYQRAVDHHYVRKLLEAGATHAQVVAILI
jgi:uncharacterized membrane protein YdcZ (DUF606 family)